MREPEQNSGNGGGLSPADVELIAAFIDRRLLGEERRAFLERLDRDEALYEVFVETVRYRDQAAGAPAEVVEHPASGRRWGRLGAVAALVAAAIATPLFLRTTGPVPWGERLAEGAGLEAALGEDWQVQRWSVTRGIGAGTDEADTAFRLGVRAFDLEVALRAGRTDDAVTLTYRLETLLDEVELSEPLQLAYERVRQLTAEGAPGEALALAEKTAGPVREALTGVEHAYDLGAWAEAGRLAARSGNRELLRDRRYRRDLARLGRRSWDPEVARELAGLSELLAAPAAELELERLESAFATLISYG